jgi:hypothetical protein
MGDGVLDNRLAYFDKLSMRKDFSATTGLPHPELVEGRTALVQRAPAPESLNVEAQDWRL